MIILFLIDKLPFRGMKGNHLFLTVRYLLSIVVMFCWNVRPWSKISPRYLHWSDYGKSALLSAILHLSLLSSFKREKRMDSVLLMLTVILHLANHIESLGT